jgi:citrate lyase beta subunit
MEQSVVPASRTPFFPKAPAREAAGVSFGLVDAARQSRTDEAVRGAEANEAGPFLVDCRMIDIPVITRAEAILGAARRLGLLAVS